MTLPISLCAQTTADSLSSPNDTLSPPVVQNDTVPPDTTVTDSAAADTVVSTSPKEKPVLEAEVVYDAEDSIRFDLTEQKVYLFGKANINYKKIELTAARIEFSMKNNTVYAYGVEDSSGEKIGKPVFKEGEKSFDSERLRYNFRSKKGLIYEVHTQEGDGDLYSEKVKKHPNDEIHVKKGKYTTCEVEDYHIRFNKAVVIPKDKIVSGPANLVIAGIPTPVVLPFGYYPNQDGEAAGVILPSYGESPGLGFYLLDGGYYWPVNQYMDTRFLVDIYSKGSWGLGNITRYDKRYKYQGNLNISYSNIKSSDPEFPDYSKTEEFFVKWDHQQDPKARPNSRFSANVNAGTSNNFRNNFNSNTDDYLSNSFQSNISWSRRWRNRPYNLNASLRHSQNSQNESFNITLPDIGFNVNRFYPFKGLRKKKAGGQKWYEKIGVTYSTNLKNNLQATSEQMDLDSLDKLVNNMRNGLRHNLSVNTSLKKWHLNLQPYFNLTDRWYLESYEKRWDEDRQKTMTDTIRGFNSAMDYNMGANLTTKLYGMYQFRENKVISNLKAVRHVITPSVGFGYRPAVGKRFESDIDNDSILEEYSPYDGTIFGAPSSVESGNVNFNLINNLEAKVRDPSDTSASSSRKIKLLENFTMASSYDIFKDSLNWSPIRINARTSFLENKLNVRFTSTYDLYDRSSGGQRIDEFRWSRDRRLGHLTDAQLSLGGSFSSEKGVSIENKDIEEEELKKIRQNPQAFVNFNVPWTLNVNYNLRLNKQFREGKDTTRITQSVDLRGDFKVTDNWKVGVQTGYDFVAKELSYTTIDIYRDLGCWEMSFNWIPFGKRRSYRFQINIKSPLLKDLKLKRRREWYDRNLAFEE